MKYQNLFSGKNKKSISICLLLKILSRVNSINDYMNKQTSVDGIKLLKTYFL